MYNYTKPVPAKFLLVTDESVLGKPAVNSVVAPDMKSFPDINTKPVALNLIH